MGTETNRTGWNERIERIISPHNLPLSEWMLSDSIPGIRVLSSCAVLLLYNAWQIRRLPFIIIWHFPKCTGHHILPRSFVLLYWQGHCPWKFIPDIRHIYERTYNEYHPQIPQIRHTASSKNDRASRGTAKKWGSARVIEKSRGDNREIQEDSDVQGIVH